MADGLLLKEKRWTFASAEEAARFQALLIALNSVGYLVREIFNEIDLDNKGYIDVVDLDKAVLEYCPDDPDFTEGSTFLMIDECFTGKEPGKVRFGVLLALVITANTQRVQSAQTLLQEWLRVSSDRINTLFSFRDSRIQYDDGFDDVDFEDMDIYDEELEDLQALITQQNEWNKEHSMNSSFSAPTSQAAAALAGLVENRGSITDDKNLAIRDDSTDQKSVKPADPSHRSNRSRRMSVRSIKMHKSIIKAAPTISIISKPRSSACTTGSSVTDILSGEVVLNTLQNVVFTLGPPTRDRVGYKAYSEGILLLTNYRIVVADKQAPHNSRQSMTDGVAGGFQGDVSMASFRYGAPAFPILFSVPLSTISRVELEPEGSVGGYELAVVCKDFRILRLAFVGNAVETFPSFFRDVLGSCAFVNSQEDLFCFKGTKLNVQTAGSAAAALVKEAAVAMLERHRSNTLIGANGGRAGRSGGHRSKSASDEPSVVAQQQVLSALWTERSDSPGPVDSTVPIVRHPSPSYAEPQPQSLSPIERSQSVDGTNLALNHRPTFAVLPPPPQSKAAGRPPGRIASNSSDASSGSSPGDAYFGSGVSSITGCMDGWALFDPFFEYYRQGLLPHPDTYQLAISSSSSSVAPTPGTNLSGTVRMRTQSAHSSVSGSDSPSPAAAIPGGPFWRLWSDNYDLVETYPSAFILPSALTDNEVVDAGKFRSRCRLPALTWRDPTTGACLVRSSQPMSGISANTNVADKLLLNLYRTRGNPHDPNEQRNPSTFYVVDCRSQLAANANAALGKGVENWKALVNTRVYYCNIANIHTMRASLESLHKVLMPWVPSKGNKTSTAITAGGLQILSSIKKLAFGSGKEVGDGSDALSNRARSTASAATYSNSSAAIGANSDRDVTMSTASATSAVAVNLQSEINNILGIFSANSESDARFLLNRIEDTGWLEHIRLVLQGSVIVAEKLSVEGCSVLVHCSDGWDRTAQVCSTAQLILDPYFRTMRGFFVLIEKDWCGFGHKFFDRIGHGRSSLGEDAKETSPVFVQVSLT
jgi:hypothetical protein